MDKMKKNKKSQAEIVGLVIIVLLKTSLILLLIMVSYLSLLNNFKFSLTLSNTTMVSLREYPTSVRIAATTGSENSRFRSEKTPTVIRTSWINAATAPMANLNSNLSLRMYT